METNSKQFWQQQYESWQNSATSKKAFCLKHSLSYPSFMYWSRKFKDTAAGKSVLKAVALSFTQPLSPDHACFHRVAELSITTDGIDIPHADGQAHITITGQISMLSLARLVEAAMTGTATNVQA
jgi:hypothetical protein